MKRVDLHCVDKSKWPKGPWTTEPDKIQWQDEKTGLPCLIVRHRNSGHFCGYVGVTKEHTYYGWDYDALCELKVHGGLTFSGECMQEEKEEPKVCHVTEAGEDDNVWWLGFDCAHCGDLSPAHDIANNYGEAYMTVADVSREVTCLARQLASAPRREHEEG